MDATKLSAAGDRVIIFVDPVPDRTEGGLFIVHDAKEQKKSKTGVVASVGPAVRAPLSAGQAVFFEEYAGAAIGKTSEAVPREIVALLEEEVLAAVD